MNSKLRVVQCSGTAGVAQLSCEKYGEKAIDFGVNREGTVVSASVHLTNRGTLPVFFKAVSANMSDLLKV
jgi:hypothetical protein